MLDDQNILNHFPRFDDGGINALGFAKPEADTRVVVAMSGGVDSSATAALLADLGFDVVGITLQLYDHGVARAKKGACCAGQDIHDARRVADLMNIPHYVLDYESRFRDSVMEDFADSYLKGETPIPCVRCNQTVKFQDLMRAARDLAADCLATGHYVTSRDAGGGDWQLFRARDGSRDQSYFLFTTTGEQLKFLRFPLGDLEKTEVRALAAHYGLSVAAKPDSQDICFVPEGGYVSVIERLRPGAAEPGDIVHLDGRKMGEHDGIIHFTIGQRRGLRLGGETEPLYVIKLEAGHARVIVGPREALLTRALMAGELNWLGGDIGEDGIACSVKIRSTQAPEAAKVYLDGEGQARVVFNEPAEGVSPGQACVIYDGERLLGGGWIKSGEPAMVVA